MVNTRKAAAWLSLGFCSQCKHWNVAPAPHGDRRCGINTPCAGGQDEPPVWSSSLNSCISVQRKLRKTLPLGWGNWHGSLSSTQGLKLKGEKRYSKEIRTPALCCVWGRNPKLRKMGKNSFMTMVDSGRSNWKSTYYNYFKNLELIGLSPKIFF